MSDNKKRLPQGDDSCLNFLEVEGKDIQEGLEDKLYELFSENYEGGNYDKDAIIEGILKLFPSQTPNTEEAGEVKEADFATIKWKLGEIFSEKIKLSKNGNIEGNPMVHAMAEFVTRLLNGVYEGAEQLKAKYENLLASQTPKEGEQQEGKDVDTFALSLFGAFKRGELQTTEDVRGFRIRYFQGQPTEDKTKQLNQV